MAAVLNVNQIPSNKIQEIVKSPDFMKELSDMESKCERPVINETVQYAISIAVGVCTFKETGMPLTEWKQVLKAEYNKLDLLTIQKTCELVMNCKCLCNNHNYIDIIENTVHLYNDCAKLLQDMQEKVIVKLYNRSLLTIK